MHRSLTRGVRQGVQAIALRAFYKKAPVFLHNLKKASAFYDFTETPLTNSQTFQQFQLPFILSFSPFLVSFILFLFSSKIESHICPLYQQPINLWPASSHLLRLIWALVTANDLDSIHITHGVFYAVHFFHLNFYQLFRCITVITESSVGELIIGGRWIDHRRAI